MRMSSAKKGGITKDSDFHHTLQVQREMSLFKPSHFVQMTKLKISEAMTEERV